MDHLWFFVSCVSHAFVSVIAALWSPAGKGLISWLLLLMFIVFLLTFIMWYPGSGVVLDCIIS